METNILNGIAIMRIFREDEEAADAEGNFYFPRLKQKASLANCAVGPGKKQKTITVMKLDTKVMASGESRLLLSRLLLLLSRLLLLLSRSLLVLLRLYLMLSMLLWLLFRLLLLLRSWLLYLGCCYLGWCRYFRGYFRMPLSTYWTKYW